jgi:hypothetical protein
MSDSGNSHGLSIGDALVFFGAIAFFTLFIIGVAILTFFSSPGMAVMAAFRLLTEVPLSPRQTW